MQPTPPPLDIVTVAIALATALFGAQAGAIVGPYAVIVLAALGGAAWSASKRPESTRRSTVVFMLITVGFALLVTVPLAELAVVVAGVLGWSGAESRWMLGPAAAVLAGVGPEWFVARLRRVLELRLGLPARQEDQQ